MASKKAVKGKKRKTQLVSSKPNWVRVVLAGIGSLVGRLIKLLLLCSVLGCVALFLAWGKYGNSVSSYYKEARDKVASSTVQTFRENETSYVYDSNRQEIARLRTDKDSMYLSADRIPDAVKKCFIATEDQRFYKHHGVDLKSTGKAVYLLVAYKGEITRGGSTITQQLVKNIFLTQEQSFERKFKEMFYAIELERKYTKDQILEFYVNDIYYGNGYYGIGAAAKGYFNCTVDQLSLAQIAYLCAIPNSPTYYDPMEHPDNTKRRQHLMLSNLATNYPEMAEECTKAYAEKITLSVPKQEFNNYEATYAIECSVKYLMELNGFKFKYSFSSMKDYKKYSKKYSSAYDDAREQLYSGGYKIYTTLDSKVQKKLQEVVDSTMSFSTTMSGEVYKLQAASTVIDNRNGKVIALVGGRSQKSIDQNKVYTLNRAYQMKKQPGSTIKPLAVYTPALMAGYTKYSIVNDTPFAGGPHNSNGKYSGKIPLYRAVEQSKNVVAWRLFSDLGPQKGLSYLQKMEYASIVPNDYYPAASLGGLYYGCTTVEMASGYATLCHDGVYREATCISSMINNSGYEIYVDAEEKRVYSEDAARTMTDILQGVIKYGTARGLGLKNGMPAAAKTGTTNDQTNGWFCGYTPYYSVSVWVGTDGTQKVDGLWGATYPGSIWKGIQDYLNENKTIKQFAKVQPKSGTTSATPAATEEQDVQTQDEATTEDSQNSLVDDVSTELQKYKSLSIDSEKSIDKEGDLYNSISDKIADVKDKGTKKRLQSELDKLEEKKSNAIDSYESQEEDDSDSSESTELEDDSGGDDVIVEQGE